MEPMFKTNASLAGRELAGLFFITWQARFERASLKELNRLVETAAMMLLRLYVAAQELKLSFAIWLGLKTFSAVANLLRSLPGRFCNGKGIVLFPPNTMKQLVMLSAWWVSSRRG